MKECTGCHEVRSFDDFGPSKRGKNGLKSRCRGCEATKIKKWNTDNPEKARAGRLRRYTKNSEQINANTRKRRAENPEQSRNYCRKWQAAHLEENRAHAVKWRNENLERARANSRRWNAANLEKMQLAKMRRQALKLENGVFVVTATEIQLMKTKPCYLCGVAPSTEIDHIIPIVRGGRHAVGNLAGVCRSCNSSKNDKFLVEYRRYLRTKVAA